MFFILDVECLGVELVFLGLGVFEVVMVVGVEGLFVVGDRIKGNRS